MHMVVERLVDSTTSLALDTTSPSCSLYNFPAVFLPTLFNPTLFDTYRPFQTSDFAIFLAFPSLLNTFLERNVIQSETIISTGALVGTPVEPWDR